MIDSKIETFAADRLNKTDFALASFGAEITSSSPSYQWINWKKKIPSIKKWLWTPIKGPETILNPDITLGNCWAFEGSQGFVTIRIANPIIPESFSIDHVPASISPDISSAPRKFKVIGITVDDISQELGEYEYVIGKGVVQNFPVQNNPDNKSFILYRLEILSNHGNQEYTCIYRFRIHGKKIE